MKINYKIFIVFVISGIIFTGIGVYASQYLASDISFIPKNDNFRKENGELVDNVGDAINELYRKKDELTINSFIAVNNANLNSHAYAQLELNVQDYKYLSFDSITAKYTNKLTYFKIFDISNGNNNVIYEINTITNEKQIISISDFDDIKLVLYDMERPKAYDSIFVNNIKLYN